MMSLLLTSENLCSHAERPVRARCRDRPDASSASVRTVHWLMIRSRPEDKGHGRFSDAGRQGRVRCCEGAAARWHGHGTVEHVPQTQGGPRVTDADPAARLAPMTVRLVTVYGTARTVPQPWSTGQGDLCWDVAAAWEHSVLREQLPAILSYEVFAANGVRLEDVDTSNVRVAGGRGYLFSGPGQELIFALVLDVRRDDVSDTTWCRFLDTCVQARLSLDGVALVQYIHNQIDAHSHPVWPDPDETAYMLGPERYQLLYDENSEGATFASATATVSPSDQVLDRAVLFAVYLTALSAKIRRIQEGFYRTISQFRNELQHTEVGQQARADHEQLFDVLGNLAFDLSAAAAGQNLFQSYLGDSLYSQLLTRLAVIERLQASRDVLDQAEKSLSLEMSAVSIRESHAASLTSLYTAATVPGAFLVSFFSLNTSEVSGHSLFDVRHFFVIYLIARGLAAIPILTIFVGRRRARRRWRGGLVDVVTRRPTHPTRRHR